MEQIEYIKQIISLKECNPDLDIKFCVYYNEILDETAWTLHKIKDVKICPFYEDGSEIFIDEDDIKDRLYDEFSGDDLAEQTVEFYVNEMYQQVKKAIVVFTEAGHD